MVSSSSCRSLRGFWYKFVDFVLRVLYRAVLVLSGTAGLFQQAVERVNQLGAAGITVGQTLIVTN